MSTSTTYEPLNAFSPLSAVTASRIGEIISTIAIITAIDEPKQTAGGSKSPLPSPTRTSLTPNTADMVQTLHIRDPSIPREITARIFQPAPADFPAAGRAGMGIVLYGMKIRNYNGEIMLLSARLPEAGARSPLVYQVLDIAFAWVLVDLGAREVAKGPGDKEPLFTRGFGERCWELDAWWRGGGGEWAPAVAEAAVKAESEVVGRVDADFAGEKKVVSEVGVRASRPKEGAARLRGPLAQADQNVGPVRRGQTAKRKITRTSHAARRTRQKRGVDENKCSAT